MRHALRAAVQSCACGLLESESRAHAARHKPKQEYSLGLYYSLAREGGVLYSVLKYECTVHLAFQNFNYFFNRYIEKRTTTIPERMRLW
jgi:hypothetical protein